MLVPKNCGTGLLVMSQDIDKEELIEAF